MLGHQISKALFIKSAEIDGGIFLLNISSRYAFQVNNPARVITHSSPIIFMRFDLTMDYTFTSPPLIQG